MADKLLQPGDAILKANGSAGFTAAMLLILVHGACIEWEGLRKAQLGEDVFSGGADGLREGFGGVRVLRSLCLLMHVGFRDRYIQCALILRARSTLSDGIVARMRNTVSLWQRVGRTP